jgi:hypothetical protein
MTIFFIHVHLGTCGQQLILAKHYGNIPMNVQKKTQTKLKQSFGV